MFDCAFTKENHWFRYRTGGLIVYDNKMLFVKSKIRADNVQPEEAIIITTK